MKLPNIHATALILGDRGLLIMGPSGSGKTTLALTMLQQARLTGRHGALIGDDQVLVEASAGRLIVHAPVAIAGTAEVHGLGPRPASWRSSGQIDLMVELAAADAPRFQEISQREISGVSAAALVLPAKQTIQSSLAVYSWLEWRPFSH